MKRSRKEKTVFESTEKKEKHADSPQSLGIPRLIHFVWAGGDKGMPPASINVVSQWASENPSFEVVIWVDAWDNHKNTLDQKKLPLILHHYKNKLKPHDIDVFFNKLPPNYQPKNKASIIIRDITQHKLVNEYIRYEIDKVDPNYGASSDQLRYIILHRFGGAYFDSDVSPGPQSLLSCPLFTTAPQSHVLYLDHLSQRVDPPPICFEIFELYHAITIDKNSGKTFKPIGGNDSYICTPGNPLMAEMITCTQDNYQLFKQKQMNKYILAAYGIIDWKTQTLDRTGTIMMYEAFSHSKPTQFANRYYEMICSDKKVKVLPLRSKDVKFTQPLKNVKNWIKEIDWKKIEAKPAIKQLVRQTHQELALFGVLRLDDHVFFIHELAKNKKLDPNDLITDYLMQLEKTQFAFNEVNVAQRISLDPFVSQFYKRHQLLKCTQILKGTDSAVFEHVCKLVMSKTLFIKLALFKSQHVAQIGYRNAEIKMIYRALNIAVDFIALLQSDAEKYERVPSHECVECLHNIQKIATSFEESFANNDLTFNPEKVESLLEDFQKHQMQNDQKDIEQYLNLIMGEAHEEGDKKTTETREESSKKDEGHDAGGGLKRSK